MQLFFLAVPKTYSLITTRVGSGLILVLCWPLTTIAQVPGKEADEWQWGLGVAVISSQKPYKDIERKTKVMPLLSFESKYVKVFGPGVEFKLPSLDLSDSQQLNASIVARYDFGSYDKDDIKDTPILYGMQERKGGVSAGARVAWTNPAVDVSAEWLNDVSGDSDGQSFSVGLEKTWVFDQHMMLVPRVAATWLDKNHVDYHYGVRQNEVRAGRPAYTGAATVNLEYGVRGVYMFDMKHSIFLDVSATSLGKEIKDSPLVDSATENKLLLGYRYQF